MLLAHDRDYLAKGQFILSQATLSNRQWQQSHIHPEGPGDGGPRSRRQHGVRHLNAFGTTAASRPQTLYVN